MSHIPDDPTKTPSQKPGDFPDKTKQPGQQDFQKRDDKRPDQLKPGQQQGQQKQKNDKQHGDQSQKH